MSELDRVSSRPRRAAGGGDGSGGSGAGLGARGSAWLGRRRGRRGSAGSLGGGGGRRSAPQPRQGRLGAGGHAPPPPPHGGAPHPGASARPAPGAGSRRDGPPVPASPTGSRSLPRRSGAGRSRPGASPVGVCGVSLRAGRCSGWPGRRRAQPARL